jgi:hypothetical protein
MMVAYLKFWPIWQRCESYSEGILILKVTYLNLVVKNSFMKYAFHVLIDRQNRRVLLSSAGYIQVLTLSIYLTFWKKKNIYIYIYTYIKNMLLLIM